MALTAKERLMTSIFELGNSDVPLGNSDVPLGSSDLGPGADDIDLASSDVMLGHSGVDLSEAARQLEQAVHDAQVAFDCIGLDELDRAHTHAITARAAADAAENALRVALGGDPGPIAR
jgi:hypothetical protein